MGCNKFRPVLYNKLNNFLTICNTELLYSSMKNNPVKTGIEDIVRLSLVNNLKLKIESLKQEVQAQKQVIEGYKRSTKTTLIN